MLKTLLLIALIGVAGAAHADPGSASDETNHCKEDNTNQQWAALARQHHDSDTWQRLFALRLGLCAMVADKQLSVHRASQIFERQRQQAIRKATLNMPGPDRHAL